MTVEEIRKALVGKRLFKGEVRKVSTRISDVRAIRFYGGDRRIEIDFENTTYGTDLSPKDVERLCKEHFTKVDSYNPDIYDVYEIKD